MSPSERAETGRTEAEPAGGTLYVVSTPIGNLGDMTYRAVAILVGVDLILAEDTRHTRRLLSAYDVSTHLLSYTPHNHRSRVPGILARLSDGAALALVTDAGTPTVSDPGLMLVREVIAAGFMVSPVPGASACLAALAASGCSTEAFVFEGFLPTKKGRKTRLARLADEPRTIVLYESPHRVVKLLGELDTAVGDRPVVAARELTKKFEEIRRGTAAELLAWYTAHRPRGEFVIVIEKVSRHG